MLTGKGVTAWRRAPGLPDLQPHPPGTGTGDAVSPRAPPAPLPGSVAAELVHVLAAVAVALAGT